jgi:hypothetical protein
MRLLRLFTEHPASVGESYAQHGAFAAAFGLRLILAGCACLVHGALPFLFTTTGSRTVTRLHEQLVENRRRAAL